MMYVTLDNKQVAREAHNGTLRRMVNLEWGIRQLAIFDKYFYRTKRTSE
jgi:hypothetical protein